MRIVAQVKYVINLIGDLHEPLHWGSADDDFGRNIEGIGSVYATCLTHKAPSQPFASR